MQAACAEAKDLKLVMVIARWCEERHHHAQRSDGGRCPASAPSPSLTAAPF